ncbi:broad specificity phosphatase PhoE [Cryobacterium mesophilum]|uniref:Histidine phosphatase family protein n=1 Tax=Terrimesophilobacter mesophilus TaxID=433647 RepID=A0A4R8VBD3_9MICO|nr:histidine phosphatase family protein [Terrimesophilobacter mesophilus]MBB5633384.1 broad specificity phosphatase PhoE [Terrimesophilobacter mesophilus]TFB80113.1 histidine phosphatase family protein [Terrimesophilobacter mesophilus]
MPASLVHLVRHGEVHNPDGVLYGRLPGYPLSELGERMAAAAAASVKADGRPVTKLVASPLQRAQESARPFSELFGLPIETDDRLIEPTNRFVGRTFEFGPQVILRPQSWQWVVNPFRPSWGEAYRSIADRMLAAIEDAWSSTASGDVVLVSHQLPIWTITRELAGEKLWHDPRKRRCSLSSITTLERREGKFVEVDYRDPARELLDKAVDTGAV